MAYRDFFAPTLRETGRRRFVTDYGTVFIQGDALRLTCAPRQGYYWATRPHQRWPCSTLRDVAETVAFILDGRGDLVEVFPHTFDLPGDEFDAWCDDVLAEAARLYPVGDYAALRECFAIGYDPSDAWGSVMGAFFDVAKELYYRVEPIPFAWHYRACGHWPPDLEPGGFVLECVCATSEALTQFGNVLHRFSDRLRAAGRDY